MSASPEPETVEISSLKFLGGCGAASIAIGVLGTFRPFPVWIMAAEVFATIIALFIFGSIRYRIDKNALTYGAALLIFATFWTGWWSASALRLSLQGEGFPALWEFARHHFFTLHGLDQLFHADTMLFILGLTFFVAVIAQTRLLETVSFALLGKNRGRVVPTVAMIIALVSFLSGILDGVSMIGLMIRTLVIILFLAKAEEPAVLFAVIVSTVVTTVCGMWLAYGEPPNLIMKANLHPYLDDKFFLRYCLPAAFGSFLIVVWNVSRRLKGRTIDLKSLDVLDLNTADVRYLQATRHGEVLTPIEFIEEHEAKLEGHFRPVVARLHRGEPLGEALVHEDVPPAIRQELLGHYVSEDIAATLDEHYIHMAGANAAGADAAAEKIRQILHEVRKSRRATQKVGLLAFLPFIGFLVWHALDHSVPLFWASFAGFAAAFTGIARNPKMRGLALKEARHEYAEYLFLLPLFFSITLLQKTGFFSLISDLLHLGIEKLGASHVAYAQFAGAAFLSAILDNNVVADFTSRALHGLDLGVLHLFSMAQIAGYAAGGCWTHIGSAQSVVAYAFIRKEINERYTPFQWIRAMTVVILEIFLLMSVIVYGEGLLLHFFEG